MVNCKAVASCQPYVIISAGKKEKVLVYFFGECKSRIQWQRKVRYPRSMRGREPAIALLPTSPRAKRGYISLQFYR